jgi:agmatinase
VVCHKAWDLNSGRTSPREVADSLGGTVHISIDMDVLDPSYMPCVGTPEPGGLSWQTLLAVLKEVADTRRVVGLDVVELSPLPGLHFCEFTAASLIYKVLTYIMPSLTQGADPAD